MSQFGATRFVGYFSSHIRGVVVEKLLNNPGLFSEPCARGYFILGILRTDLCSQTTVCLFQSRNIFERSQMDLQLYRTVRDPNSLGLGDARRV